MAWLAPAPRHRDARGERVRAVFSERSLAGWLAERNLPCTVYAFEKVGVRPLRAAYQRLVEELRVSAVVLVDGGRHPHARGRMGLGTPAE